MERRNKNQSSWREKSNSRKDVFENTRQTNTTRNERPQRRYNDQRQSGKDSDGYKQNYNNDENINERPQRRYNDQRQGRKDSDGYKQDYNNKNEHKKIRPIGFKFMEDLLDCEDLENVIFTLSNDKRGFKELLDSVNITNDTVVLVVKLISKICDSNFGSPKSHLLQIVLNSNFVDSLVKFVSQLPLQGPRDKKFNNHFWKDTDSFWYSLLNMTRNINDLMPTTTCEHIFKFVKAVKLNIPLIENEHKVHISDEIKASIESLYDIIEKKIKDFEAKRLIHSTPESVTELEPPDDYKDISIYPSSLEVTNPTSPFLRPNIVKGPYKNIHQYLDIQFRLLREDFVTPLRKGICRYMQNPKEKLDDIKIYKHVQFLNMETVNEQNCYRVQFDFSNKKRTFNYENSRRFMFGSLVCFTADNFITLIFGKIVQRDVKDLEKGQVIVGFNADVILPENISKQKYLMVESTVYFEPYYHVLKVLKTIQNDSFPMEDYIIKVKTETSPPAYLLKIDPVFYTIENDTFSPLDWDNREFYGLNQLQNLALKSALTQEFTLIQGPPGTGKTFLGLKIAHTLLNNKSAWYNKTPLLVICYTNHALDQFLEGLLTNTNRIIRVGSQSKNEKLNKYNIRCQKLQYNPAIAQKRNEVRSCLQEIKTINKNLSEIELFDSIVNFTAFKEFVPNYNHSWFDNVKRDDIKKWLLEGKQRRVRDYYNLHKFEVNNDMQNEEATNNTDKDNEVEERWEIEDKQIVDEVFDDITVYPFTPLISLKSLTHRIGYLRTQQDILESCEMPSLQTLIQQEKNLIELNEANEDFQYLQMRLTEAKQGKFKEEPDFVDLKNPNNMTPKARWQLYCSWVNRYVAGLSQRREVLSNRFRYLYRNYNEMREMEDTQVMKEALVVGMTTTGASRLQASLQTLKSPIVIVEEAAEILEAHIVSSLTKHCKHLILIGDHQQLKPGTACYKIETKFLLGISLFERMVANNVQCYTLSVQHRMRPEISSLIHPSIYPILEDHESVLNRPPILGLENCVYFINHQEPEQVCSDASKKNIHEAKFLIRLAIHLILNGYKPEDITILAAYLGQMFEIQREKKLHNLLLKNVRIAVLDNYQGEESDIILLSLVRNNAENKIGFLKIENRVCVALSRARFGFFMMGNMSLLCDNSEIWPKIKDVLEKQNSWGSHLTLRCQIHRHKITRVKSAEDFMEIPEGGCNLMCETILPCDHVCKSICHITDRDHKEYKCHEKCNKELCDDPTHLCQKLCYEDCGDCYYPVLRNLDCGHNVSIFCHIDPAVYKCTILVKTVLPCGHEVDKPCHKELENFICPFPCNVQVEPCGHACTRKCHLNFDPDHLQYNCLKPCTRARKGCRIEGEEKHICPNMCFQECADCDIEVKKKRKCSHVYPIACKQDVEIMTCKKTCTKQLPCGHKCKLQCNQPCGFCTVQVSKVVPDCKHTIQLQCNMEPDRKYCRNKCPRLLPCGHQCIKKCFEDCNTTICNVPVACSIPSPCGHIIKTISCHLKNSVDPKILLKNCTEKCNTKLKCEHICSGTCGKCFQGRMHARCEEKCGIPLICNHECPIPCRQACKPCERKCEYKCAHSKCAKKCGDPCIECQEICSRQCKHQRCKKSCGAICDVPPCNKPCKRKLKCGHQCVGFCGDPCPVLCKICNNEELTEICLGREDEENAIYVMLEDCKHIFESQDMEQWLNSDNEEINVKVCPKCKTAITKTQRYSDYIKRCIFDISNVKIKSCGSQTENHIRRDELMDKLNKAKLKAGDLLKYSEDLKLAIKILQGRLEQFKMKNKQMRRQNINRMDLDAIKTKCEAICFIIDVYEKQDFQSLFMDDKSVEQVSFILKTIMRDEDRITDQEIDDVLLETERLSRYVQFERIQKSPLYNTFVIRNNDAQRKSQSILQLLEQPKRYSKTDDNELQKELTDLNKLVNSRVKISESEKREIVSALGLSKGHWFKCRNGHYYVITECGGAMQISRCNECGEQIGGQYHRLLEDQSFAPEMDGAQYPAWSDVANMANYRF